MRAAAGVVSILLGLGFGIPCALGIRHLAKTGEVWTLWGFPTYGGGYFERAGVPTTVPLLVGFLIVCVAEVVLGVMLIVGVSYASALSYALLPFEFAYWIGFSLPLGPPLGVGLALLLLFAPLVERSG
ncbi:MAG: hypothetical protein ACJ73J_04930 [Actinomycetes bacterium]